LPDGKETFNLLDTGLVNTLMELGPSESSSACPLNGLEATLSGVPQGDSFAVLVGRWPARQFVPDATKRLTCRSTDKLSFMKLQLFIALLILASLGACKKSTALSPDALNGGAHNDTTGIYGQWTWVNSIAGPWKTIPPSDSSVTLTLNSDNSYLTAINGKTFSVGTFQLTGTLPNSESIHFNNVPATQYSTQNGDNLILYGSSQIGELLLFVDDEVELQNDSLHLLRTPISPEDYNAFFTK